MAAIDWESPSKHVRLSDGQVLQVSVSSCVGENDEIRANNGQYWVKCANGDAQLLPLFLRSETIRCGGIVVPVKIKEIETREEFDSYQQLSEFHYRGHRRHGRTSVLIVVTDFPLLPRVLGYIQIATPFYMNKCRAAIVDTSFNAPPVVWEHWDKNTSRQYINVFVRIARTVVHPEFRGLGIGQLLVRNAIAFVQDHWHVAKLKPLFLEIVADMLKYVPFAERAGMHFIGYTEGNVHRVAKDMAYLISRKEKVHAEEIAREDSVGVVDMQVAYMNSALAIMKKHAIKAADLKDRLEQLASQMSLQDYEQLQSIIRLPKPTFIKGVSLAAENFLTRRLMLIRLLQHNAIGWGQLLCARSFAPRMR